MMVPVLGPVTAGFYQERPLTAKVKTHNHGAWDIAAPVGAPIAAPEAGYLYYCAFFRPPNSPKRIDVVAKKIIMPFDFRSHYYWADIYGPMIILQSTTLTWVITHSYMNQLYNRGIGASMRWDYVEEDDDGRWPICAWHTFGNKLRVDEGERIGYVGNAGFSTGPHIHMEVHKGKSWNNWKDRIDPATIWPEIPTPKN
jgi:hypothetical protein